MRTMYINDHVQLNNLIDIDYRSFDSNEKTATTRCLLLSILLLVVEEVLNLSIAKS